MNKTRRNRSLHGAGGPARCPRLAVVCGALALVLMLATTGQAQTQTPAAPGQTDDPLRPLALEGAPDATTPWWRLPSEASGARLRQCEGLFQIFIVT